MALRTETDESLLWLMGQTFNPASHVDEVMEVFEKWWGEYGGYAEVQKERAIPLEFSPENLGRLAVEVDSFFREGFYRLSFFINPHWVRRQFEGIKDNEKILPRWESEAKTLVKKSGRDPSAYARTYARRRLGLLLVGALEFPRVVPYRSFLEEMQNFFYANCSGPGEAERILSGIVAEASFMWALRDGYDLLVSTPRLDFEGVDFALPAQQGSSQFFLFDVKGRRSSGSQVGFITREPKTNEGELSFPVIEVSIPTDYFGSSHRGRLCVCFPPTKKVCGDIVNGVNWIISGGKEGVCPCVYRSEFTARLRA